MGEKKICFSRFGKTIFARDFVLLLCCRSQLRRLCIFQTEEENCISCSNAGKILTSNVSNDFDVSSTALNDWAATSYNYRNSSKQRLDFRAVICELSSLDQPWIFYHGIKSVHKLLHALFWGWRDVMNSSCAWDPRSRVTIVLWWMGLVSRWQAQ